MNRAVFKSVCLKAAAEAHPGKPGRVRGGQCDDPGGAAGPLLPVPGLLRPPLHPLHRHLQVVEEVQKTYTNMEDTHKKRVFLVVEPLRV